ncbi:hypothetical protein [Hymenobacter pini]|uniref:hypothetical protein n=1 Tax=Hymenobacter pini TaxID=2880879 RepID=UPI001CF3D5EA|nr:hypothetical protein [Hymenobacter pini]MCA8833309.1 hypothetical protein [Hymenobacter pini]
MNATGILINRQLPQLAKLSNAELWQRVAQVEAIRTTGPLNVSLLIGDKDQFARLQALHTIVRENQWPHSFDAFQLSPSWVPFVVEIPPALQQWLANHSWDAIRAQLVNWLGALHAAHCLRFQMWRKLLPEIKQWAAEHYSPYVARQADELIEVWAREYDHAQQLVGGPTEGVLENPFRDNERPFLDKSDVLASYRFSIRVGYFRADDWLCIVERSRSKVRAYYKSNLESGAWTERTIDQLMQHATTDNMHRSEADAELWQQWRQHFMPDAMLLS